MGILGNEGTPFNSDWTRTAKQVSSVGKDYTSTGKTSKKASSYEKSKPEQSADKVGYTIAKVLWNATHKREDRVTDVGYTGDDVARAVYGYLPQTGADIMDAAGLNPDNPTASPSGSDKGSGRGRSGYGSGYSSAAAAAASSDDPYAKVLALINETAQKNNEWSAQQAQIDRDWQKMMSDTSHVREIADLKAAGLNPVLSAGGSGAGTPSGAMAQTDTSNTRLIAEVAMSAIDAVSNTAASYGGVARKAVESGNGNIFNRISNAYNGNKFTKKLIDTALNTAGSIARLSIVKHLL